eukprot:Polyplicarium_translucidae@DN3154_c3_g1_i1.p1
MSTRSTTDLLCATRPPTGRCPRALTSAMKPAFPPSTVPPRRAKTRNVAAPSPAVVEPPGPGTAACAEKPTAIPVSACTVEGSPRHSSKPEPPQDSITCTVKSRQSILHSGPMYNSFQIAGPPGGAAQALEVEPGRGETMASDAQQGEESCSDEEVVIRPRARSKSVGPRAAFWNDERDSKGKRKNKRRPPQAFMTPEPVPTKRTNLGSISIASDPHTLPAVINPRPSLEAGPTWGGWILSVYPAFTVNLEPSLLEEESLKVVDGQPVVRDFMQKGQILAKLIRTYQRHESASRQALLDFSRGSDEKCKEACVALRCMKSIWKVTLHEWDAFRWAPVSDARRLPQATSAEDSVAESNHLDQSISKMERALSAAWLLMDRHGITVAGMDRRFASVQRVEELESRPSLGPEAIMSEPSDMLPPLTPLVLPEASPKIEMLTDRGPEERRAAERTVCLQRYRSLHKNAQREYAALRHHVEVLGVRASFLSAIGKRHWNRAMAIEFERRLREKECALRILARTTDPSEYDTPARVRALRLLQQGKSPDGRSWVSKENLDGEHRRSGSALLEKPSPVFGSATATLSRYSHSGSSESVDIETPLWTPTPRPVRRSAGSDQRREGDVRGSILSALRDG